jgi:hypothetical protein
LQRSARNCWAGAAPPARAISPAGPSLREFVFSTGWTMPVLFNGCRRYSVLHRSFFTGSRNSVSVSSKAVGRSLVPFLGRSMHFRAAPMIVARVPMLPCQSINHPFPRFRSPPFPSGTQGDISRPEGAARPPASRCHGRGDRARDRWGAGGSVIVCRWKGSRLQPAWVKVCQIKAPTDSSSIWQNLPDLGCA